MQTLHAHDVKLSRTVSLKLDENGINGINSLPLVITHYFLSNNNGSKAHDPQLSAANGALHNFNDSNVHYFAHISLHTPINAL